MTTPSATKTPVMELADALDKQAAWDHVRGCDGRTYSCSCGYDAETDRLLTHSATQIRQLVTALEFYADPKHWSIVDGFTPSSPLSEYRGDMGDTARAALTGKEPQK